MFVNIHNSQQRLRVKKDHRVLPEREQNIPLQNIPLILGGLVILRNSRERRSSENWDVNLL